MDDRELEDLMKRLRSQSPTQNMMAQWKQAAQQEAQLYHTNPSQSLNWYQLVAAMVAGVLIGIVTTKQLNPSNEGLGKNNFANATTEYVYVKTN